MALIDGRAPCYSAGSSTEQAAPLDAQRDFRRRTWASHRIASHRIASHRIASHRIAFIVVVATFGCNASAPEQPPALTVLRAAVSQIPSPPSEPPGEWDGLPAPSYSVAFAWDHVSEFGEHESTSLVFPIQGTIANLTGGTLVVESYATGDAGTNQTIEVPAEQVELPAFAAGKLSLDLDAFGFDHALQKYSGRLGIEFRVYSDVGPNASYETVYAPDLFYHPEDVDVGVFAVYDAEVMREVYHAGDYALRSGASAEPGVVIDRIVEGTRVEHEAEPRTAESVLAEGDDASPESGGGV